MEAAERDRQGSNADNTMALAQYNVFAALDHAGLAGIRCRPHWPWRERVLTLGTRRVVEDVLNLDDDVEVAGRKWVHVSATKTRRRLAALARELEELHGATFGPTPHRVTVLERSVDEVSFRCLMPAERGGGSLDRMWSFANGSLVGVGLRSAVVPDVDLTTRALDRAVRVLFERVAA